MYYTKHYVKLSTTKYARKGNFRYKMQAHCRKAAGRPGCPALSVFLSEQASDEHRGHDRHGHHLDQNILQHAHVAFLRTKNKNPPDWMGLERVTRLELATSTLARWRSTG